MNTNNAPERIAAQRIFDEALDIQEDDDGNVDYARFDMPTAERIIKEAFAAMQPQVSECDVDAARTYTRKVAETVQEGNKLDDPVADNGYTVEDALMHLFPFSHRQPAAVSADADVDIQAYGDACRLDGARNAVRMREALKLVKTDLLVCAGDPFVASAIKTIDAALSPETVSKGE